MAVALSVCLTIVVLGSVSNFWNGEVGKFERYCRFSEKLKTVRVGFKSGNQAQVLRGLIMVCSRSEAEFTASGIHGKSRSFTVLILVIGFFAFFVGLMLKASCIVIWSGMLLLTFQEEGREAYKAGSIRYSRLMRIGTSRVKGAHCLEVLATVLLRGFRRSSIPRAQQ